MHNRLDELQKKYEISNENLARELNISDSTLKSYKNGNRDIPSHIAIQIKERYNVTLDWLYGLSNFLDEHDIMVDIMLALDKIFKFTTKKGQTSMEEPVLLINKTFYDYIREIQRLQQWKDHSIPYKAYREEIYSRYRDYFKEIWKMDGFDDSQVIEINNFEGLTVADFLSYAVEK